MKELKSKNRKKDIMYKKLLLLIETIKYYCIINYIFFHLIFVPNYILY